MAVHRLSEYLPAPIRRYHQLMLWHLYGSSWLSLVAVDSTSLDYPAL